MCWVLCILLAQWSPSFQTHKVCSTLCVCFSRWVEMTHQSDCARSTVGKKPPNLSRYCFLSCSRNRHLKDMSTTMLFFFAVPAWEGNLSQGQMRETFNYIYEKGIRDKQWTFYSVCLWVYEYIVGREEVFSAAPVIHYLSETCLITLWEVINSNKAIIRGYWFLFFQSTSPEAQNC